MGKTNTKDLAAEMGFKETPTDSYGMPLQILPPKGIVKYRQTNRHHPWHPNSELQSDSDADRSLRHSTTQRIPWWVHRDYHLIYGGPNLNISESDKFFLTVLGRARYISQEVLS